VTVLFRAGYDAARSGDLAVTITETGGGGASGTATLSSTYMPDLNLSTINRVDRDGVAYTYALGYVSALTALQTALNAIANSTITVTFSTTTRKWTIAGSGGGVTAIALTFNAAAARYFGFSTGVSAALTHTGDHCAYYVISGTLEGVSDFEKQHESGDDVGADLIAADGTVEGLAQDGVPRVFSMTIPDEPAARVWHENRSTTDPWTWELAYAHCRNIEPFHIIDSSPLGFSYVGRFRADAMALDAQLAAADYFAYASIPLRAYYLGTP
jgi:hypothetical protein